MKEIVWSEFESEVLSKPVVLVSVCSDGCKPCEMICPALELLEKEIPVVKMKIKRDGKSEIEQNYAVKSTPTLLVFKDGKYSSRQVGVPLPQATLEERVSYIKEGIEKGFVQKASVPPAQDPLTPLFTELGKMVVEGAILGLIPLPSTGKIGETVGLIAKQLEGRK